MLQWKSHNHFRLCPQLTALNGAFWKLASGRTKREEANTAFFLSEATIILPSNLIFSVMKSSLILLNCTIVIWLNFLKFTHAGSRKVYWTLNDVSQILNILAYIFLAIQDASAQFFMAKSNLHALPEIISVSLAFLL